jgi:hypothetical protein
VTECPLRSARDAKAKPIPPKPRTETRMVTR